MIYIYIHTHITHRPESDSRPVGGHHTRVFALRFSSGPASTVFAMATLLSLAVKARRQEFRRCLWIVDLLGPWHLQVYRFSGIPEPVRSVSKFFTWLYTAVRTVCCDLQGLFLANSLCLFGMVKWPFRRLSDLQLGDPEFTLNRLVEIISLQSQLSRPLSYM